MVVYIDVFFLINFFMDMIILLTVRKISAVKTKLYRLVIAALIGSVYACILLLQNVMEGIIEGVITYIVMSIVMALVSFGYKGRQKMAELITLVFVVTFTLSGVINILYSKGIIKDSAGLIVGGAIGAITLMAVFSFVRKQGEYEKTYVRTRIVKGDCQIEVKALVDTGNSLREPLSKKPVAVICQEAACKLKKGDDEGVFLIPYKSVGMEHGILRGFLVDYMEITKEKNGVSESKIIYKPILAEYVGKFTENNHYQMLLHPQMMEEGEGNVWKKSIG